MPNEAAIRDRLANNLSVLEPGLTLVDIEVPLKNSLGAGGRIDILARDSIGNRVVIEIKRSDASARTALHEIFKYLSILQVEQSLPAHKIRCILVSTDWHELRAPFSEFVRTSPYQVEGRRITVDSTGEVVAAEAVNIGPAAVELSLFRHYDVLLFTKGGDRDAAIESVVSALDQAGSRLAFALSLDYAGFNSRVVYPFAIYVAVARIEHAIIATLTQEAVESGEFDEDTTEEEKNLAIAQSFSGCYMEHCSTHDTYEIGYPEKCLACRRQDWRLVGIRRQGPDGGSLGLDDDEEVESLVSGEQGQNHITYCRVSSPRLHAHWKDFRQKARRSLTGNDTWTHDFRRFLKTAAVEYSSKTVSVNVYNPLNVLLWLSKVVRTGDPRYIPELQCIVSSGKQGLAYLHGTVEAWQEPEVSTLDELLDGTARDLFQHLLQHQTGIAWQHDGTLMSRLGLRYTTLLHKVVPNRGVRSEVFSRNRAIPPNVQRAYFFDALAFQRYVDRNAVLIDEIVSGLDAVLVGD